VSNRTTPPASRCPKVQTESKTQRSVQKKMMPVRVISVDDAMRTAMRGMGDVSSQVEDTVRKTSLATVSIDTKVHEN
jgi:hypothetical protein